MYYVNFDPATNHVISISPQKENAVSVGITDELGRKFEEGIENFINWHVALHKGEYVFRQNKNEIVSNKNIHCIPLDVNTKNYIELVQINNKIFLQVQGDEEYKKYLASNESLVNIFVTEKNNPYALLNTIHFMLKELTQNLEFLLGKKEVSLYMHNPAYTFKHTRK